MLIKKLLKEMTPPVLLTLMVAALISMIFTGCNKQIIDTSYTFDKAILYVGGEWITINVDSWKDYEDGDQIQVKDTDGNTYLVHSTNITLIHSADNK
jgi:hypothetical protein